MLVPSWRGPRQHGQFSAATVAIPAISSRVEIKSNRDTSRFRGRSSFGFPSSFDIRPSTFPPGAGGGTRTHTAFYGPRILSPVRLPFRHTGNRVFSKDLRNFVYELDARATFCATVTAMTSNVTQSDTAAKHARQSRAAVFTKAVDGRKQPVRGLWIRNGRYYGRLDIA